MDSVRDLTKGPIVKNILLFYFPLLATNLLQQLYQFADTAIVGQGLGENELAAVGNMGSLSFLIVGFSMGLSTGFTILIGQFFGANDYKKLRKAFAASILLAAIISVLLTILSVVFLKDVLLLLRTNPVIIDDSLLYGRIIFGGLITSIAYNLAAATLRALGDSKTPLYALIVSSITNVALNSFFIFICKSGVEGVAIATVISQILSAILCIKKIASIECMKIAKSDFKNEISLYLELLINGVPMAIMNSITAVGCMVVQYFVNGFNIVSYTAAYSAGGRYTNLFMQPACTAGYAMSSFTSQNYGARKFDRIKKGLLVCLSISFFSYVLFGSIMELFPHQLSSVFLKTETGIEMTSIFLRICGFSIIGVDFLFIFRTGVQGMSHPIIPMISGVAEMVFRVGTVIFFSDTLGFSATAWAETSAWLGAMTINMIAFFIFFHIDSRKYKDEKVVIND